MGVFQLCFIETGSGPKIPHATDYTDNIRHSTTESTVLVTNLYFLEIIPLPLQVIETLVSQAITKPNAKWCTCSIYLW